MAGALRRIGLQPAIVRTVVEGVQAGSNLEALLLGTMSALPAAPRLPRHAGALLVVVGRGTAARALATTLAVEIGHDPTEIPYASLDADASAVVTSKLLVRSSEDAAERSPSWRLLHPAIVVVDAPLSARNRPWATALIASLRPTAVWGLVDATAKPEDVAHWAHALGGVGALALDNMDATVSPAAILDAAIPVARLNGAAATASIWVATIVDRLHLHH
jgi:hypothetical protein